MIFLNLCWILLLSDNSNHFLEAIAQSLRIEYYRGGVNQAQAFQNSIKHPYSLFSQLIDGDCHFQFKNEKPVEFKKGCATIIPANCEYRRIDKSEKPRTFRWSHINIYVLGGIDFFSLVSCPYMVDKKIGEKIGQINLALAETLNSKSLKIILRRKVLCFELLELIYSTTKKDSYSISIIEAHTRLSSAFKFMQDSISESVTHKEIANKVNLSPSRFHTLFKELTGKPPLTYLFDMRLKQAQIYLMEEDRSIAEVGRQCGFNDQFHFSRQFKKSFGQSPMQYRKEAIAHLKSLNVSND